MADQFLPFTMRLLKKNVDWISKRPLLNKFFLRLAEWHDNASGFRKYGLLQDDIIPIEHNVAKEALTRLTDKERFDRNFRLRRAVQLHLTKEILPKDEWSKREEDEPYLYRHIMDISHEVKEKSDYDSYKVDPHQITREKLIVTKK